ncbi:hypothetical protein BKH42_01295 [Helicobacter sp. 13S00482-2]|nr:hypothetical protein BKH42_01295 [Helicobacter sp. 13S00482-2]
MIDFEMLVKTLCWFKGHKTSLICLESIFILREVWVCYKKWSECVTCGLGLREASEEERVLCIKLH